LLSHSESWRRRSQVFNMEHCEKLRSVMDLLICSWTFTVPMIDLYLVIICHSVASVYSVAIMHNYTYLGCVIKIRNGVYELWMRKNSRNWGQGPFKISLGVCSVMLAYVLLSQIHVTLSGSVVFLNRRLYDSAWRASTYGTLYWLIACLIDTLCESYLLKVNLFYGCAVMDFMFSFLHW
jgi:hypothetical protein